MAQKEVGNQNTRPENKGYIMNQEVLLSSVSDFPIYLPECF
jgi:hypothetical protein